jgi:hypothetical protein
MIQHSWYFVSWKFINFTELQYAGVAKKQEAIHTQITLAGLQLELSDVLRTVGMKERSVMCAIIAVHVQLSHQGSQIFHMHCLSTLQALYQNHIISCLQTSSTLHDITKTVFQQVCECHTCCGNLNVCSSVQNQLPKSSCFYLSLTLHLILETAFLSILR